VRRIVQSADARLPVEIDPLTTKMRQSVREERLLARLASGFGVGALLLAAIGLYGVMTYAVTRRTGEIGLRVALGAQRQGVIGLVVGDALRVVVMGFVVGLPVALGTLRLLGSELHGVEATDPVSLAIALSVLLVSAMVAVLLPALRASRVSPIVALREE
jgi:ABC-type antimicrobial peptide transport system permease subunit